MVWHSRVCFRRAACEGVAAVQHDFFGPHFSHMHVDALADPATGPDELQAGPDPHGLRHVGGRRAGAGVLDRDSFRRGQAAVVPGVDPDAAGVGDDEAHVRLALSRESFSGRLECLGQGLLPGLVDPRKSKMPGSLLMFSVSLWCQPPVRSWSSWQCLSSRSTGVPAKLSMMAGNWRKSSSNRNLIFRFMETQAMAPCPAV